MQYIFCPGSVLQCTNSYKHIVCEEFVWYLDERVAKSLEAYYVYKVPVLRMASVAKLCKP